MLRVGVGGFNSLGPHPHKKLDIIRFTSESGQGIQSEKIIAPFSTSEKSNFNGRYVIKTELKKKTRNLSNCFPCFITLTYFAMKRSTVEK